MPLKPKTSKSKTTRQQRRQKQRQQQSQPAVPETSSGLNAQRSHSLILHILAPLVIIIAGLTAYANSFAGEFLFDDIANITNRSWLYGDDALEKIISRNSDRPLTDATFVFNIRAQNLTPGDQLDPTGFHVVNLTIHLIAALALFGVVRRTLRLPIFHDRFTNSSLWIALTIALIWTVHPLQTQAVTYIVQRAESLMAMFYLLTLYCYIRGATASMHRWIWFASAVLAGAAGMASKPIMVTAPILILLYDYCFLWRSYKRTAPTRAVVLLLLAATWIMLLPSGIAETVFDTSQTKKGVVAGFSYQQSNHGGKTWWHYFLTQTQVIMHYLRLSVWPSPLVLDYKWPLVHSITTVIIPLLVLLTAGLATVWALIKRPTFGFIAAAFFIILAPTSSIMPIIDAAFEHRMYLPLAAVITIVVISIALLGQRLGQRWWNQFELKPAVRFAVVAAPVLIIVGALSAATHNRNRDYQNAETMWRSVLEHRPHQARAMNNLATELVEKSKKETDPQRAAEIETEACALFKEIIESDTSSLQSIPLAAVYYSLGNCYKRQRDTANAMYMYQQSIALNPRMIEPYVMWGNTLSANGQSRAAEEKYRQALQIGGQPRNPNRAVLVARASYNLGNELTRQGRRKEALAAYLQSANLSPTYAKAYLNAGQIYETMNDNERAIQAYQKLLQLIPTHTQARARLQRLQSFPSPG